MLVTSSKDDAMGWINLLERCFAEGSSALPDNYAGNLQFVVISPLKLVQRN